MLFRRKHTRCIKQTIEEIDGTLVLKIAEWPKGPIGWVFKRSKSVIPIDSIETFATMEPDSFVELAHRFYADKVYSELPEIPARSSEWHRYCGQILRVADAHGVKLGGMFN